MAGEKKFTLSLVINTILEKMGIVQARKEIADLKASTNSAGGSMFSMFQQAEKGGGILSKGLGALSASWQKTREQTKQTFAELFKGGTTFSKLTHAAGMLSGAFGTGLAVGIGAAKKAGVDFTETLATMDEWARKAAVTLNQGITKSMGWLAEKLEIAAKFFHMDGAADALDNIRIGLDGIADADAARAKNAEDAKKALEAEIKKAREAVLVAQAKLIAHSDDTKAIEDLYDAQIRLANLENKSNGEALVLLAEKKRAIKEIRDQQEGILADLLEQALKASDMPDLFSAFLGLGTKQQEKSDEEIKKQEEKFKSTVARWVDEQERAAKQIQESTAFSDQNSADRVKWAEQQVELGKMVLAESLKVLDEEIAKVTISEDYRRELILKRKTIEEETAKATLSAIAENVGYVSRLLSDLNEYQKASSDERIRRIEKERDAAIAAAQAKGQRTDQIEAGFRVRIEKEKKKEFERNKKYQLVMADINAAAAIINAWATAGNVYAAAAMTVIIAAENEIQKAIIKKSKYQGQARSGADRTKEGPLYVHDDEAVLPAMEAEKMRAVGALLQRMSPAGFVGAAMASVGGTTRAMGEAAAGPRTVNVGNLPENMGSTTTHRAGDIVVNGDVFAQDSASFERKIVRGGDRFRRNVEDRNTRR